MTLEKPWVSQRGKQEEGIIKDKQLTAFDFPEFHVKRSFVLLFSALPLLKN